MPIVLAAALWGRSWTNCKVICYTDNSQVVSAIKSGATHQKTMAHLVRCLFFLSASWGFTVTAAHIPGRLNGIADALSRNYMKRFHTLVPMAQPSPSHIPPSLQAWVLKPVGHLPFGGLNSTALWVGPRRLHYQDICLRQTSLPRFLHEGRHPTPTNIGGNALSLRGPLVRRRSPIHHHKVILGCSSTSTNICGLPGPLGCLSGLTSPGLCLERSPTIPGESRA